MDWKNWCFKPFSSSKIVYENTLNKSKTCPMRRFF